MADQRHSKSNHEIELCMRDKDREGLEQREGETGFDKSTHTAPM